MQRITTRQLTFTGLYLIMAALVIFAVQRFIPVEKPPRSVPYNELLTLVASGNVREVQLGSSHIVAEVAGAAPDAPSTYVQTSRLPGIDETQLMRELVDRKVQFVGKIEGTPLWQQVVLGWVLPVLLLVALYFGVMRVMNKRGSLSFGRTRARVYDLNKAEHVTFADVAGVPEAKAELVEIIGYLKTPARYQTVGARVPKGVLLVGPPGTGKTLLARAVAGEAGVPFFSLSGSEFVEMFVGVGAARMRDLFEQAKEHAPCIVFIDELDAIGKSRGGPGSGSGSHDEREQTLNQLLVEMDGFDSSKGVVMMAATNRPEVLDSALLRAGRFDRQVVVDRPDVRGRYDILRVHARKLALGSSVSLDVAARRTPGMVGADLANVMNEAALAAVRRGARIVEEHDLEEAIDRIQLGLKKHGRAMQDDEKRRVSYHESGHTLVALAVEHADPVHRVTIIPRSIGALGAMLQLPTDERYLMTREELKDRICVMLGGRAAEELIFRDVSTGAQNDLERATETARQMVCRFGMSDKLGPLTFGRAVGSRYLDSPVDLEERNFSEHTARQIDSEVRAIIDAAHRRALQVLAERRWALEQIATQLLERETLDYADLEAILVTAQARDPVCAAE
jgi:cell division protease FtsH